MNAVTLAIASIRGRLLPSMLCVLGFACGIALLTSVYLLFIAAELGLRKNAEGIDVVVGAKGSPLQLVLSSVYHADVPNGNIDIGVMETIARNPNVKSVTPVVIGDNYKGFRIVGTTPDYLKRRRAQFAEGNIFMRKFEAVAGAATGLKTGEKFAALHGFSADDADRHDAHLYVVTGVLAHTGTVLDRLILTPYAGVQDLHAHPDGHEDHDSHDAHEDAHDQVTALLVEARGPAAKMNLPSALNRGKDVMAVSPSLVLARVMKNSGMGRDGIILLGAAFLGLSMLMLLSVLASGLAQRRYDLAVLRVLGASPQTLGATIMAEGLLLSIAGSLLGVIAGHFLAFMIALQFPLLQSLLLPSTLLHPAWPDILFLAAGATCGIAASAIPGMGAARTDIAGILARGR